MSTDNREYRLRDQIWLLRDRRIDKMSFSEFADAVLMLAISSIDPESTKGVRGTVQWIDKRRRFLYDIAGSGYQQGREHIDLAIGDGVTGTVAKTGQPALIRDLTHDDFWSRRAVDVMDQPTVSEVVVPLWHRGKVIGVFNLESPYSDIFEESDIELMNSAGKEIVIGLESIQLRDFEEQFEHLSVVNKHLSQVTSFDAIAPIVLDLVKRYFESRTPGARIFGTVQWLEGQHLIDIAGDHYRQGGSDPVPIGHGVTGRVIETQEYVLVRDSHKVLDWQPQIIQAFELETCSELAVPMRDGDSVQGVLNLESDKPRVFNDDHVFFLEEVAQQLVNALRFAQLYRDSQKSFTKDLAEMVDIIHHTIGGRLYTATTSINTIKSGIGRLQAAIPTNTRNQFEQAFGYLTKSLEDIQANINDLEQVFGARAMEDLAPRNLKLSLDRANESVNSSLGTNMSIDIRHLDGDVEVLANEQLDNYIFAELMENSNKYRRLDVPAVLNITYRIARDMVEIVFSDNGIGLDPSETAQIFKVRYRGSRTKDAIRGTGMGLWGIRKLIENWGGSISAQSPGINLGTTFILTLPLAQEKAQ